jgi:hypothetical protein
MKVRCGVLSRRIGAGTGVPRDARPDVFTEIKAYDQFFGPGAPGTLVAPACQDSRSSGFVGLLAA